MCPYCGVGCQLTYNVKDNTILFVEGKDGPANHEPPVRQGPLRLRLRAAPASPDQAADPQAGRAEAQATSPSIRTNWLRGVPRGDLGRGARRWPAAGCATSATRTASSALAGFGSAKGTQRRGVPVPEAGAHRLRLEQRRPLHAPVPRLERRRAAGRHQLGRGVEPGDATSRNAEVIFVIGANPTVEPSGRRDLDQERRRRRGAKLIVADPRRSDSRATRTYYLQFKPDTDVALLNAMMHMIVEEGLVDEAFIRDRTQRLRRAARERRRASAPRRWRRSAASTPRRSAKSRGCTRRRRASMILWGMGISQHVHGTDNARCLIALALMTGQIGKPGHRPASAARPEQRAGRVRLGPDPDVLSRTTSASTTPEARQRFETLWGTTLDPKPGLTVVEIMNAAHDGKIRGMYIMGENPAMSDPDVDHAREALADARASRRAGHLPHRDRATSPTWCCRRPRGRRRPARSPTPTAWCSSAARRSSRRATRSQDLWIISELARRLGLDWHYAHPREVFDEMRQCDGLDRRHHLGAARARMRGHLSVREGRRSGRAGGVHRALPDADAAARSFVPADLIPGGGAARRRVPVGADHRPPARALAHRQR